MDTVEKLRQAIAAVFAEWEKLPHTILSSLLDSMYDSDDEDRTPETGSLIHRGSSINTAASSLETDASPLIELTWEIGVNKMLIDWSGINQEECIYHFITHYQRTARDILLAAIEELARKHPDCLNGEANFCQPSVSYRDFICNMIDKFLKDDFGGGHKVSYPQLDDPLCELIQTLTYPELMYKIVSFVAYFDHNDGRRILREHLKSLERQSGVDEVRNQVASLISRFPHCKRTTNAITLFGSQYL